MSRKLDDLAPEFRKKAFELLARCVEARIPVTIVGTGRTEIEQQAALAAGTSWVTHSKHQDGLAIDICPTVLLKEKNWAPASPLWQKLGVLGQYCGLEWGGEWKVRDLGHFEAK